MCIIIKYIRKFFIKLRMGTLSRNGTVVSLLILMLELFDSKTHDDTADTSRDFLALIARYVSLIAGVWTFFGRMWLRVTTVTAHA